MPYRTLIIEDQELFRSLLARHIQSEEEYELVGEASLGACGWELFNALKPDLVLLDIVLPDTDGLEIGKRILRSEHPANVLAMTSQTDAFTTNRIYESGFQGYVEKEQPIEILQEAMATVAEGGIYFTRLLRENRHKIATDPAALQKIMSLREQEILSQVAHGATSQEIADLLSISRRTVENHRYRIMKKLNIKTMPGLIKFVLERENG
jgi:two-component system nitrate/nitrite response regulator NarL